MSLIVKELTYSSISRLDKDGDVNEESARTLDFTKCVFANEIQ